MDTVGVDSANGIFYGTAVSLVFVGIVLHQGINYFASSFKDDSLWMKMFVASILIQSVASACLHLISAHNGLFFLASGGGDLASHKPDSMYIGIMFNSGLLFFLVHVFFASRLHILTKRWYIPFGIVAMSTVMLGLSAYSSAEIAIASTSYQYYQKAKLSITIFHILAALSDIVVSVFFSIALAVSKSATMSRSTLEIVTLLLATLVARGAVLAAVQICHLIMFLLSPGIGLFWVPLHVVLDQLNTITTLIILNSRAPFRERMDVSVVSDMDFATRNESVHV